MFWPIEFSASKITMKISISCMEAVLSRRNLATYYQKENESGSFNLC